MGLKKHYKYQDAYIDIIEEFGSPRRFRHSGHPDEWEWIQDGYDIIWLDDDHDDDYVSKYMN